MQEQIENYLDTIAKNIRLVRENAQLSQENLAEKIDCSREFVNRVENRKENIGLKTLLMLAIALNVKPQDFFNN